MNKDYVVVIGGMNIDIAGLSGPVYREKDSNIGEVSLNIGGVGQNIAQNLVKLDVPTYLITVWGDDNFSKIAQMECEKNHINLEYGEKIPNERASIYLYIDDNKGDLVTAINDMKIVERITPEFLENKLEFINSAKLVVLDCNLPQKTIEWIAENVKAPIFVDPVSAEKVDRITNILDKIDTLKPNEYEACILTGIKVEDEESAKNAAKKLNDMGVKNVFISLGEKGIVCSGKDEVEVVHPLVKQIVNTNGAGDCAMATIVWSRFSYGEKCLMKETGIFTQAAASINLESAFAVAPELSVENMYKRLKENNIDLKK